jgi:methylmalonyl-CoA/ethylmalonyl-CoA epimerase
VVPGATLAHVGVAVTSLADALAFYRDVLHLEPGPIEEADGSALVSLALGPTTIELLEPMDPDGPIAKFLARRGPGIHHLCYRVPDLDAALERCRLDGYHLIDRTPRLGAGGHRIAFIHPKSTSGILIELTE